MGTLKKTLPTSLLLLSLALMNFPAFAAAAASEVNAPTRAKPGEIITVSMKTQPKAWCSLETQGEALTQVLALRPKTADSTGYVNWTLKVSDNYHANKMPLIVTSKYKGVEEKVVSAVDVDSPNARQATPVLNLVSAPSSTALGDNINIKVHTTPGAKVKIEAQGAGLKEAFRLTDRKADADGIASWTFNVGKNYKANCLPIVITSDYKNVQKKLVTAIEIGAQTASKQFPKLY